MRGYQAENTLWQASQKACQGHDEAGNILKPLSYQCRAFLFIWTACCPMQANVNSAVTSALALQISSLILPAGSWNGRRAGRGGRERQVAASQPFRTRAFFFRFFFFSNNPSKMKPFFKKSKSSSVLPCSADGEQVAIANFNGYYISIQESANDMLAKALALMLPRD